MGGFRLSVDDFGANTLTSLSLFLHPVPTGNSLWKKHFGWERYGRNVDPDLSSQGGTDPYSDRAMRCRTIDYFLMAQVSFHKLKCLCK